MSLLASGMQRMPESAPLKVMRDAIRMIQPELRLRLSHSFKDHLIDLLARDCPLAELMTLRRRGKNGNAICMHME